MGQFEKLLLKILSGGADNNLSIDDIIVVLKNLGFYERKGKGSHMIFKNEKVFELINIQKTSNGKAKNYQIKQIRDIIIKYNLLDGNE